MVLRVDEPKIGGALPQISREAAKGLSRDDIRNQLVGRPFDEIAPKGSGEYQLLGMIHQSLRSTPGLSLNELPLDVAQQILSSRAETMQEFFDSWSASIRENAEKDKKATQKRLLLAQVLNKAVNGGLITQSEANAFAGKAGIANLEIGVSANEAIGRQSQKAPQNVPRAIAVLDAMKPPPDQA